MGEASPTQSLEKRATGSRRMARLRPSWLFRRLSSRDSKDTPKSPRNTATTTSTTTSSTSASPTFSTSTAPDVPPTPNLPAYHLATPSPTSKRVRKSTSLPKLRKKSNSQALTELQVPESVEEKRESVLLPEVQAGPNTAGGGDSEQRTRPLPAEELTLDKEEIVSLRENPLLVVQEPTPDAAEVVRGRLPAEHRPVPAQRSSSEGETIAASPSPDEKKPDEPPVAEIADDNGPESRSVSPEPQSKPTPQRPTHTNVRKQSIADSANAKIVKTLIEAPVKAHGVPTNDSSALPTGVADFFADPSLPSMTAMLHRKIWVKRPGASATLVQIKEDDLVDDVRDFILRKYANSLGKTFDAPDMTLNIITRSQHGEQRTERLLGPEEEICRTIDAYYPGGQTVDEALIINVPQRRTPRPSPRMMQQGNYYATEDYRPLENGTDYFPPMPAIIPPTLPQTTASDHSRASHHPQHLQHPQAPLVVATADHPRAMSVLNTGQVPPLPSPGGRSARHHRPKMPRQPTSSPTILSHPTTGAVAVAPNATNQPHLIHRSSARPRLGSTASETHHANGVPPPPPLPSPPAAEAGPTNPQNSNPPTPAVGAPPPRSSTRPRKSRKSTPENLKKSRHGREGSAAGMIDGLSMNSMLDGSVPPISVLIVEDNIINLRILEGLMKRLKVRWQTAMNGQIAVDKWREGGYHLVLMDIQMPVMNGLQATKEIRRLERVNGIGVFSSSAATSPAENGAEADQKAHNPEDDKLSTDKANFKSPIIIVALTASSLQSDRHEALAAGCNDFLTKPVNFVWLERKVKEWGCMQALIDFDGWRQWKAFAEEKEAGKSEEEKRKDKEREEKERVKAEKMAKLQEKQAQRRAEQEKEKEKKKRASLQGSTASGDGVAGGGEGNGSIAEE